MTRKKKNCWEFKRCERKGECPASKDKRLDGTHGGNNAGRACWMVAGTLCSNEIRGTFAQKYRDCRDCDFYKAVREEEGLKYILSVYLQKELDNE